MSYPIAGSSAQTADSRPAFHAPVEAAPTSPSSILRLTLAQVREPGGIVALGATALGLASRGSGKRKPKH